MTTLIKVEQAARKLGISRSVFYEDVKAGRWDFAVVRVGRELRLSWPAIERFLADPRYMSGATVPRP